MPRSRLSAVGLWLAACSAGPAATDLVAEDDSTGPVPAGSTGEPEDGSSAGDDGAVDPCEEACFDRGGDPGRALCHSCRCREAFDGWLPAPEELQCGNGDPIVVYHADLSGRGVALEPAPPGARECANPSLLTGSCQQGSRLGRIAHGDAIVRLICRDPYLDYDGSVLYHDVALIGHNTRTGATCFWDDVDDRVHDGDLPPLDLMAATEEERVHHRAVFEFQSGDVCVRCHDHDPFVYTPYLESTDWVTLAANKGPYSIVELDGTTRPTGVRHLVSPEAGPCVACHRLGDQNTCRRFAPDAMGLNKDAYYEDEVRAAAEPGDPHWRLAHWMPGSPASVDDFAAWLATFADARDHILTCCESPGDDIEGCRWAPVPASP